MADSHEKIRTFKIVLLGNSGVGKTSIINQFISGFFQKIYSASVGTDFFEKKVEINGEIISLQLWDTAGQERFQSLGKWFYRGTDCCVLVYDVSNPQSLACLNRWKAEFLASAEPSDPDRFPFIIVGNKMDLVESGISACQYKKEMDDTDRSTPSFLISAKDSNTVDLVFQAVAEKVTQSEMYRDYDINESKKLNVHNANDNAGWFSSLNCC